MKIPLLLLALVLAPATHAADDGAAAIAALGKINGIALACQ